MIDWDERYRQKPALWSGEPGPLLVREVSGMSPGRAMELGCGEGADAIWLAAAGWQVDALDISTVALGRGRARAEELGLGSRIRFQQADLGHWRAEPVYDLVSAQFLHSTDVDRSVILAEAARAVAPGGTLLIVSHQTMPPWQQFAHHEPFPSALELAEGIGVGEADWRVEVAESVDRTVTGPEGQTATVTDSVLRAARR